MADKFFPESQITIRRTIDLLPQVFKTSANSKFMAAVVDPLVQPGVLQKNVGYIGRRHGKTFKGSDIYLDSDQTLRSRYQLEPGVVFEKDGKIEKFYDYIDFKNQLRFFNNNLERDDLITSQEHYSWNPPIEWDMFVNYREYYWVPSGPPAVKVLGQGNDIVSTYKVRQGLTSTWIFYPDGATNNPTITLYRGQTYKFNINSPREGFYIRTAADTGSLAYNSTLPYAPQQLAVYDGKLWRAKTFVSASVNGVIVEGPEWELVDENIQTSKFDYNVGITNNGEINGTLTFEVPLDAPDILYYQSSTNPDRFGRFIVADIEDNTKIDVENEIIGKETYTSSNSVELTNGLIVRFGGKVSPSKYAQGQWLVERVGRGIKLIDFSDLEVPIITTKIPDVIFDNAGFDTEPFDDATSYPGEKDYLTICRSSIDLNPWSRYNRWFHRATLDQAHSFNGSSFEATDDARAKRPIITFNPDLQLYNHGSITKTPVDFIDTFTTDIFSTIEGSIGYSVDGEFLFEGARVLFTADTDTLANNKIYKINFINQTNIISAAQSYNFSTLESTGRITVEGIGVSTKYVQNLIIDRATTIDTLANTLNSDSTFNKNFAASRSVESLVITAIKKSGLNAGDILNYFAINSILRVGQVPYKVSPTAIESTERRKQIALRATDDTESLLGEGLLVKRGNVNKGLMFHFDGTNWVASQKKTKVNQTPLFDIFDVNGISFSNADTYPATTFAGTTILEYVQGSSIVDTELGFSLSYLNIDNVGDILFKYCLDSDTFTYTIDQQTSGTVNLNTGFYRFNPLDEFGNGWILTDSNYVQPILDHQIIQESTNTVELNTLYWDQFSQDTDKVIFYLNGTILKNSYTRVKNKFTFSTTFAKNDALVIKVYTAAEPDQGYYKIPLGLEKNPLNQNLTQFTLGQASDHISMALEVDSEFSGFYPGNSNLRNIDGYQNKGMRFLKHSGVAPFALSLLCEKEINIIKSIQYSLKEYTEFKNEFIKVAESEIFIDNIADFVDNIISTIGRAKNSSDAFSDTDMIGSGAHTDIVYTVEDEGIQVFALSEKFDLTSLSRKAVYVYVNDVQLVYKKDYDFDSTFGFVKILATLIEGDVIKIKEYTSTAFNYIPATPTKLGLYKKYLPQKFLDDTYVEPKEVIQGHDGSLTTAYGDYRDDVLLELELRIYNNIKQEYNEDVFDIDSIFGGYYGNALYTKSNLDAIVNQEFLKWVSNSEIDYTNSSLYFDRQNSFTYTYSNMTDPTGTINLPGYWRGVYQWFYDTVRPHQTPWEMLGFSEQPVWWETEYGPAPYTSNNLILWEDIRDGIIRQGPRAGTYDRYARPTIMSHIPTDGDGNLLSPLDSGLATNFTLINNAGNYRLGDISPAEYAWRSSSEWPFAVVIALSLLKPFEFITDSIDRSRLVVNKLGQTVFKDTGIFVKLSDIVVGSLNGPQIAGLGTFINSYIKGKSLDPNTLSDQLSTLDVKLSTRLSGFVDQSEQKYLLDSKNPNSSTSNIFVPPENYDIIFNVGVPITSLSYSGVLIEKYDSGWKVLGYDPQVPYFNYYKPVKSTTDPVISVGGTSERFVNWAPGKIYNNGDLIQNSDKYYRAIKTHTSGELFDDALWKFIPKLPIVGGVEAALRRTFNTLRVGQMVYGTILETVQDVVDFLLGYEYYLKTLGFKFDRYNASTQTAYNWQTSCKEFLFWTKHNWAVGSLLTLSPAAEQVDVSIASGVAENLFDPFYDYQIFKSDGTPIATNFLNVERDFQNVSISTVNTNEGIYFIKMHFVLKEHVALFDDRTVFNDVIYDKTTGYRQERIKARGFRTTDWDGDYTSPGFLFDNVNIQTWQPYTDYRLGDIVSYRSYNWTSLINQQGEAEFDDAKWTKLDTTPVKGLVSNFDYRINQFEDYYDVDADGLGSSQRELSRHVIGYQTRDYLQNLAEDNVSQFKIYQGFIKEKGSANAITKVFDKLSRTQTGSVELNEEWAFRVGRLGGTDQYLETEFRLLKNQFVLSPQPILLAPTSNNSDILDQYLRVPQANFTIAATPFTADINPVRKYSTSPRTAGYVNLFDVDFAVKNVDGILNLNIDEFQENTHVWITFYNASWTVWRYNVSRTLFVEGINTNKTRVELVLNNKHGLSVGDIFGIRRIENITGFHKITEVPNNKTIVIQVAKGPADNSFDASTMVPVELFTEARYADYNLANKEVIALLTDGAKIWVDKNASQDWEVIQKSKQYSGKLISDYGTSKPLNNGAAVAYNDILKQIFSSTPKSNVVVSYAERTDGLRPFQVFTQEPGTNLGTAVNKVFGETLSVSPDGRWLAVGSPRASGVRSDYREELKTENSIGFDSTSTYTVGDIVLHQGKLWRAKRHISQGYTFSLSDWEVCTIITANSQGANTGYYYQGLVTMYEWSGQNWVERYNFVSPRQAPSELYGSQINIGVAGNDYYMAISAPGAVAEKGRVYLYKYSPLTSANSETITYTITETGSGTSWYYLVDGVPAISSDLVLLVGNTYIFDQSTQINVRPLSITADPIVGGNFISPTLYSTGITYILDNSPVSQEEYYSNFNVATTRKVQIEVFEETDNIIAFKEQLTFNINSIVLEDGGSGFTLAPLVAINGDGSGALAQAFISTTTGKVTSVNVISAGTGYTYADIVFYNGVGTNIVNPTATAVLAIESVPANKGSILTKKYPTIAKEWQFLENPDYKGIYDLEPSTSDGVKYPKGSIVWFDNSLYQSLTDQDPDGSTSWSESETWSKIDPVSTQGSLPTNVSVDDDGSTLASGMLSPDQLAELIKPGDKFGTSMSMNRDGSILVVGTPTSDGQYFSNYRGTWNDYQEYREGDVVKFGRYYYQLNADAEASLYTSIDQMPTLGNPWEQVGDSTSLPVSGKIYIYQRNEFGIYNLKQTVNADSLTDISDLPSTDTIKSGDQFGYAIDIDYTGHIIIVSSPKADSKTLDTGSVYVLKTDSLTNIEYRIKQKLQSFENYDSELFGSSVSITEGTERIAVGAKNTPLRISTRFESGTLFDGRRTRFSEDQGYPGQVYVYELKDQTYLLAEKLETNLNDNESFGYAIDASTSVIVVGSPGYSVSNKVAATNLSIGQTYKIEFVGTTDFTLLGAEKNKAGEIFAATSKGTGSGIARTVSINISAGAFVIGQTYVIVSLGNTNWNEATGTTGNTYVVGDIITCATTGSGTGVVKPLTSGMTRLFKKDTRKNALEIIRQETALVDIDLLKSLSLYDDENNVKLTDIDIIDNNKLKILGIAEQELKFKTPYDPATYTFGDSTVNIDDDQAWFEKNVGMLWWNIGNAKWVYAEQSDIAYRTGSWNLLAEGASIDICEWVETILTPTQWAKVADTAEGLAQNISGQPYYTSYTNYSIKQFTNPSTGQLAGTKYYFWVKGKTIVPQDIIGRKIAASSVASLIENPAGSGLPLMAIVDSDKFLAYNLSQYITGDSALINIEYYKNTRTPNRVHTEYQLLTEGIADSLPTDSLEQKWLDSLIGFNNAGNSVPDPTLLPKQKYGIAFRPIQTMFVNRETALKVVIDNVNLTLQTQPFTDLIDFENLNQVDQIPNPILNLYDLSVDTLVDLNEVGTVRIKSAVLTVNIVDGRIDSFNIVDPGFGYRVAPPIKITGDGLGAKATATIDNQGRISSITVNLKGRKYTTATISIRNFSVLVRTDSSFNNYWSIYSWDNDRNVFYKSQVQSYNTPVYWDYSDWYQSGYSAITRVVKEISNLYLEPTVAISVDDILKIKEYANGGWALLQRVADGTGDILGNYVLVGRQNGTIQIKNTIYNLKIYDASSAYDEQVYDNQASKELRYIFQAIKENIFINDLRVEWNKLFFTSMRYVFSEQLYVDWAFKTSFLNAVHNVGTLEQKTNYKNDNLESFQKYLEEVKPYRTTIREYTSRYTDIDRQGAYTTDFDLPATYDNLEGRILPVNENSEVLLQYPWKSWADNNTYEITAIEISYEGADYVQAPTVVITGDGTGATAQAFISNGKVSGVRVLFAGTGYTKVFVSLVGGNGTSPNIAKAVGILGNGKVRSFNLGMKFDRISKQGLYEVFTYRQTGDSSDTTYYDPNFVADGFTAVFDLKYPPTRDKTKISVAINGEIILDSNYNITFYNQAQYFDTSAEPYTLLKGKLILLSLPAAGDIISIDYEKNDTILDSVDRINKYYSPTSGMLGKEIGQLMTGIDFGGVQIQGTTFDVSGGWDALPWFTDSWDSVIPNSDYYYIADGSTRTVTLPYTPSDGQIISVYWKPVGQGQRGTIATLDGPIIVKEGEILEPKTIRIDDPNYSPDWDSSGSDSSEPINPNAQMPSFVGDGVSNEIEIGLYLGTEAGDTLIFRPIESDGTVNINDVNIIDTNLTGGTFSAIDQVYQSATGTLAEDIVVDGSKFISPDQVPAPEENIPGQVLDSVSIKVFHTEKSGAAPLHSKLLWGDGITRRFAIGATVLEAISIIVYVDKIKQGISSADSGIDYIVDFNSNEIEFITAPDQGSLIEIISIGIGGIEILDYQEFEADGDTVLFLTKANYELTQSVVVTVDGIEVDVLFTNSTDITDVNNRTMIQFANKPDRRSIIKIVCLGTALDADSGGQSLVRVNQQTLIYDGSIVSFDLDKFVNLTRASATGSILVDLNGLQLKGVDTTFVVYNGTNNVITIGTDPLEPAYAAVSDSLKVIINNEVQRYLLDYRYDGATNKVTVNTNSLSIGDEIKIEVNVRSQYFVEGNNLILAPGLLEDSSINIKDGDVITVTWFSEYPSMNITEDQYTGGKVQYQLSREPISSSYVWVYRNGLRLTIGPDYEISIPRSMVYMKDIGSITDEVKIVQFGNNIRRQPIGYEIFKDMLNTYHYKRFSLKKTVVLSEPLNYYDNEIKVSDTSDLFQPIKERNIPGTVWINNERIDYFEKTANSLGQLRRGSYGTAIGTVYSAGTEVVDMSKSESLPYNEVQERLDYISDGSTLLVGPLTYTPTVAERTSDWNNSTNIPEEYGPCNDIEVFVAGKRLRKTHWSEYNADNGLASPDADVIIDPEFSVDGISPYVRITDSLFTDGRIKAGTRITVIRRTGKVWYDKGVGTASAGVTLTKNQTPVMKFLTKSATELPE